MAKYSQKYINAQSETITIKECERDRVTECYTNRSRITSDDNLGKGGVNAALTSKDTIIANNIFEDCSGEAIGSFNSSGRTLIVNNICRFVTTGRNHILNEGDFANNEQVKDDTIIANNNIYAAYYGIYTCSLLQAISS